MHWQRWPKASTSPTTMRLRVQCTDPSSNDARSYECANWVSQKFHKLSDIGSDRDSHRASDLRVRASRVVRCVCSGASVVLCGCRADVASPDVILRTFVSPEALKLAGLDQRFVGSPEMFGTFNGCGCGVPKTGVVISTCACCACMPFIIPRRALCRHRAC
jgi:hypothetical protein